MAKQYLAIGPHGWAKADRSDYAVLQCLDHIAYWEGSDTVPIHVYRCDDTAYVDGMGYVCWSKDGTKPVKREEIEIPSKRVREYKDMLSDLLYGEDVVIKYFDSEGNPE